MFCDYRKSVIFRSGPFMPQLHPHPLMHRTPAHLRLLRLTFPKSSDAREGMRTVWHLTRAMTSEAMEMRVAENLLAQSEVHFGTPPWAIVCFKTSFLRGVNLFRNLSVPFKIRRLVSFLHPRVDRQNGEINSSRSESFKTSRLSHSKHRGCRIL